MNRYRLIIIGLALALAAAACGDDGADTTTPNPVTDDGTAGDDTDPPAATDDGAAASDAPEIELTATARGVSAEAITIGVLFPDLSNLGIDNGGAARSSAVRRIASAHTPHGAGVCGCVRMCV